MRSEPHNAHKMRALQAQNAVRRKAFYHFSLFKIPEKMAAGGRPCASNWRPILIRYLFSGLNDWPHPENTEELK